MMMLMPLMPLMPMSMPMPASVALAMAALARNRNGYVACAHVRRVCRVCCTDGSCRPLLPCALVSSQMRKLWDASACGGWRVSAACGVWAPSTHTPPFTTLRILTVAPSPPQTTNSKTSNLSSTSVISEVYKRDFVPPHGHHGA